MVKGLEESYKPRVREFFLGIEDDDGIVHPIKIKKAIYVPDTPSFLIDPQQWA